MSATHTHVTGTAKQTTERIYDFVANRDVVITAQFVYAWRSTSKLYFRTETWLSRFVEWHARKEVE